MSDELIGQDAVEQAEPTAPESAPGEQTANDQESAEAESPASAETEPQDDSRGIPRDRFNQVNETKKALELENQQLRAYLAQQNPQAPTPELDDDAARAVVNLASQVAESRDTAKFESRHAKEFAQDKLLYAAYRTEAEEAMRASERVYIDREEVLQRAKAGLEARGIKLATAAKEEGIREGQDIAKTKQKLGAVGETGKTPDVSDDQLSAAEFAKKYNISTVN